METKRVKIWKQLFTCMLALVLTIGTVATSARAVSAAAKGYTFTYKKVTVQMGGKAKSLIKKAGTPEKKKAEKSCAYEGKDRTYQYKDFILYTYSNSDNGTEYVNGITFRTDKVKTKEGIKIGSTQKAVEEAYGKVEEEFGVYNYVKGNCRLQIMIDDGKVSNIRYQKK